MQGILGKKVGMTHIFSGDEQVPVTVISAGPNHIVQKKSVEKEGYAAVQIGFGEKKASRTNKPMAGHFKKNDTPSLYHLREFALEEGDETTPGQVVKCSELFKAGDHVDISAKSKGKGFSGVIKRWNHSSGPEGHGSKHNRAPGSIGQGSDPSKVFKGMKMPGQHGNKIATIQNLEVMAVKDEENILLVRGSVPGAVGTVIEIRKSLKK